MLYYILFIIAFLPLFLIYPVRVVGKRNIPKKGKMILVANHQTLNDPIIMAHRLTSRRRYVFMAKKELFKSKFSNWFLKKLGAFPVDNKSTTDLTAVKTTLKLLKEDKAVCIYPEGGRFKSDEANEVKHGVAMFALKSGAPIIPSCFIKKTNAFRFNTYIIGEPLYLSEMEQFKDRKIDKDVLDEASEIIGKSIYSLKYNYENRKNKK